MYKPVTMTPVLNNARDCAQNARPPKGTLVMGGDPNDIVSGRQGASVWPSTELLLIIVLVQYQMCASVCLILALSLSFTLWVSPDDYRTRKNAVVSAKRRARNDRPRYARALSPEQWQWNAWCVLIRRPRRLRRCRGNFANSIRAE